ncbi:MAG: peptidylprolyl isomerase [Deltaproteobacteria bacterium]|nr:peptidylprolyl isomerase [Deltaproteobacteria bacterium]
MFFLTRLSGPGAGNSPAQALSLNPADNVQDGSIVSIEYTLTDEAGKVIDSNVGKEPLTYIHGAGQIVPGLEKELSGLKVGAQKTVTVKPEEGYGPLNPELIQELPKDRFPQDALKVDSILMMQTPQGPIPIRIMQIKGETVVVDLNSPLAGKTLTFDVRVSDIKESSTP